MANDLELYDGGGDIAPYAPSQPLAPSPDWGTQLSPREIDDYQSQSGQGQVQLFGENVPATQQQVAQAMTEISALIASDLMRLGHQQSHINAALQWFQNSAQKTPVREAKRHSYQLYDQAGDLAAESWANAMARAGATQEFVSNCLWLMAELVKRLDAQQVPTAMDGPTTSADPTDQLSDQQFNVLVQHNENVKAQTVNRLAAKYGEYTYRQVIELAQTHLESLPLADRQYFDTYTGGWPWTHMLSTFEAIDALYGMAIGANSIGDGASIAREIAQFEAMLKVPCERAKYNKDPQLQARLLELYRRRG